MQSDRLRRFVDSGFDSLRWIIEGLYQTDGPPCRDNTGAFEARGGDDYKSLVKIPASSISDEHHFMTLESFTYFSSIGHKNSFPFAN